MEAIQLRKLKASKDENTRLKRMCALVSYYGT